MARKKTVTKKSSSKGFFLDAMTYLRGTRRFIYIIIVLFFLSSLIGFAFSDAFRFFDPILAELAGKIEGMSTPDLIWFIFQNNITSAFFGMLLGVFVGIFPVINALTNGSILGYVYSRVAATEGLGIIWLLLPHGIFELPAVFIALGLGVRFGMFIFAKEKKKEFVRRLKGSLKVFFAVVLPLLIIAAIIEAFLIASRSG